MTQSTHDERQRTLGEPQVTGGGGHEPDPSHDVTQDPPAPAGNAGLDLKSSELPEPDRG